MDISNFPEGFTPLGADFLEREENKAVEFTRLRLAQGRGVARGLVLTRQNTGAVVLSSGFGNDAVGNAIVLAQDITLDLSAVALPPAGKFRQVAVVLEYQQLEQGERRDSWAERVDSYKVNFLPGLEASSAADALRPVNNTQALLVGDILFDDHGTMSADSARSEKCIRQRVEIAGGPTWQEFSVYPKGATVLDNGTWYIATAANTATAQNAPGAEGAPWIEYELYLLNKQYPIGIYLLSNNPQNPATYLQLGTWQPVSSGLFIQAKTVDDSLTLGDDPSETLPNVGFGWNLRGGGNIYSTSTRDAWSNTDFLRAGSYWISTKLGNHNSIYQDNAPVKPKSHNTYIWYRHA